jgi:uncharacterized phiE125 gp8 family phage protein
MKISFSDDDTLIASMITSARLMLEKYTALTFATKTLQVMINVDEELFELPYGPVTSIVSVTRVDAMGVEDVLTAGTEYELVSRLIRMNSAGVHIIKYNAGYLSLPQGLKTDIMRLVAWMYQNRGIQFEAEDEINKYPEWKALAANAYQKVIV